MAEAEDFEEAPGNRHLFVGGLPWECDDEALRMYFNNCVGKVEFAKVARDRESDEPRGFGWVTMVKAEVAAAALQQVHWIDGRSVNVRPDERKAAQEGAKGKGKDKGKQEPPCVEQMATVRFKDGASVSAALEKFNGQPFQKGPKMVVEADPEGRDYRKVIVRKLQPSVKQEDLKEQFSDVGDVVFVSMRRLSAEDVAAQAAAAAARSEQAASGEAAPAKEEWDEDAAWAEDAAWEGAASGAKKAKRKKAGEEDAAWWYADDAAPASGAKKAKRKKAAEEWEEGWGQEGSEGWAEEAWEEQAWEEKPKKKKKKQEAAAAAAWDGEWQEEAAA